MLYLLESDTRNVKWNGIPLHEATSAIIKEQMNGDFTLTVRYPITDSEIYQFFREDMLIKAPAPVIGPQLFRIKKPVENDDHLEITAYHITDDVMQRSINPLSVNKQSCWQALSQLVQVAKSPINDFSFTSDITDRRTINTKEVETLYSVLMDGAHSIVGTWEGEMVRDNFAISIKRNRGEDRGVIISTHKNLKSYQRTKNSQNIVTRIHAKSTFKAEGAKEDTTIAITVDSPLIGAYPYINERSYSNNNIQTVDELTKWASAKFTNEHIDKATDAIKIEAYELDGQTVHMGDTVNLKSYKHNVDVYKKAIAYEYDCLANNGQGAYLTITFDDKVKSGGNGGGVSAVANAILDKQETKFDIMLERAIANADRAFDAEFAKREKTITDAIEQYKAKAEEFGAKIHEEMEKERPEFVKRIREELMSGADSIAELSKKLEQVSETARVNASLIGGDGNTQYNKNRLNGGTAKKISYGTDFVEVGHNGEGFELGKQYVISWSATCTPYSKTDVTVVVNKNPFYGGHVHLAPANSVMPAIDKDLVQKEEQVLAVYYGAYRLTFSGDWYQDLEQSVTVDNQTRRIELAPVYKTIADGQNARYDGSWNESPTFIFDGGRT
ncbi:phage tail spike protein [Streptococcus mitis]|uniref:phage tail spike protein n=1 Tax=Streptococcus mitis TaxID=28037 RepID=UPI00228447A7|nr:phage tail spike protein [Streptococcus mitis]MCY7170138.1 phage tail protein [Streptococcus mitis]